MRAGSDGSPLRAAALLALAALSPAAESQTPSIRPPSPFAVSTHDRWAFLASSSSFSDVRIAWSGDVYRTEFDVVPVVRREATSTTALGSQVPVALARSLVYGQERPSADYWSAVIHRERVVFEDRGDLEFVGLDWGGDPSSVRIATDALGSATSAEARRLPPGARVYGGGRAVGWRHADGTFDLEELAWPAND